MEVEIRHDMNQKKFYALVGGQEAHVLYQEQGKDVLNYLSTFVPEELRGEGIAAQLAEFALNYARKHHYKIIPTCPYISHYIKRHKEYQNLVK